MTGTTPMAFETVRDALTATLTAGADARFSTDTFQRQSHGADELVGNNRHVSVFYRSGAFEKSRSGWMQGPFKHAATFSVQLLLAAPSKADLTVLNPQNAPNATPQELMSALAAMQEAGDVANLSWDELARIIWQILMDPRNAALGLTTIGVADRWISNVQKEEPSPLGEYVLLGGTMDYTCTLTEALSGETGTQAGANAMDIDLTVTTPAGTAADSAKAGAQAGGL